MKKIYGNLPALVFCAISTITTSTAIAQPTQNCPRANAYREHLRSVYQANARFATEMIERFSAGQRDQLLRLVNALTPRQRTYLLNRPTAVTPQNRLLRRQIEDLRARFNTGSVAIRLCPSGTEDVPRDPSDNGPCRISRNGSLTELGGIPLRVEGQFANNLFTIQPDGLLYGCTLGRQDAPDFTFENQHFFHNEREQVLQCSQIDIRNPETGAVTDQVSDILNSQEYYVTSQMQSLPNICVAGSAIPGLTLMQPNPTPPRPEMDGGVIPVGPSTESSDASVLPHGDASVEMDAAH